MFVLPEIAKYCTWSTCRPHIDLTLKHGVVWIYVVFSRELEYEGMGQVGLGRTEHW